MAAVWILAFMVVALVAIVIWLIWTTTHVSGSVRRTTQHNGGKKARLDAEIFVETHRRRRADRSQRDRTS
jgi:hypothetical protein